MSFKPHCKLFLAETNEDGRTSKTNVKNRIAVELLRWWTNVRDDDQTGILDKVGDIIIDHFIGLGDYNV